MRRFACLAAAPIVVVAVLAAATTTMGRVVTPAIAAASVPIESVALIDIMPGDQQAARQVLDRYLSEARADPGLISAELVLQTGTSNHFMLLQRFRDSEAADAHARLPFVRAYRIALFPHLGSPYDERSGSDPVR